MWKEKASNTSKLTQIFSQRRDVWQIDSESLSVDSIQKPGQK